MFENEELVLEGIDNEDAMLEGTENVETPTEEVVEQDETPEKTFTQSELEEIVQKNVSRAKAKVHREYERKYGNLESVLKAGTGKEDVGEITDAFRNYYKGKGMDIPEEPVLSDRDAEILGHVEADEIIDAGYEEVVEEVDRLAQIGLDKMNPKERAMFGKLASYRTNAERGKELAKIGVTEDVYNSKEFKNFAAKFSSSTPVTEIYQIFNKMQPRKEVNTMGSMKSGPAKKTKDYYTPEEIERLTEEDLDDPNVWEAVRKSMTGQA